MFYRSRFSRLKGRNSASVETIVRERRLRLECLEERRLLTIDPFTWIGDYDDEWSRDENWHGEAAPGNGDTAMFTALAQRDPRLTGDTTVGAIRADTGSQTELNLDGHTLETKLAAGIEVTDSTEGAGTGIPAKLDILNSGAGKTVTTDRIYVGVNGHTPNLGNPNKAEMSITTSAVTVSSSGNLLVGGRNQATVELKYGISTVEKVSLGGTANLPSQSPDFVIAELTVGSNATLTANNGVVLGTDNLTGSAAANKTKLISKLTVDAGAQVSAGSLTDVQVGRYHRGELLITGGGRVSGQGLGTDVTVGMSMDLPGDLRAEFGKGLLKVDGNGSKVDARYLGIGHSATTNTAWAEGKAEILDDGVVEVAHDAKVGYLEGDEDSSDGAQTEVTVDGGTLTVKQNMTVGRNAKVTVSNNGTVDVKQNFHLQGQGGKLGWLEVTPGGKIVLEGTSTNDGLFQVHTDGQVITYEQGVTNQRIVRIGSSPGKFELDGNFTQQGDGLLEIEIAGYTPVTEHDLLEVADYDADGWGGQVTLGGTLQALASSFYPQLWDEFTVVRAPVGGGTFLEGAFDLIDASEAHPQQGGWGVLYDRGGTYNDPDYREAILKVMPIDIDIDRFYADGQDMLVEYTISGGYAPAFEIGIYASPDNSQLGDQLMLQRVDDPEDLTPGSHTVPVTAAFEDIQEDYYLGAKVDALSEVGETDEDNNQEPFEGGAFIDGTNRVVHVQGTDPAADAVDVVLAGNDVKVTFNGQPYYYPQGDVFEVHIRTHDDDDTVTAAEDMPKDLWGFGGDDDDDLQGGGSYLGDYFEGGSGDDWLEGGYGDDWLEGGSGDDRYVFKGSTDLGSDTIAEWTQPSPDGSRDTLDFNDLGYAVNLDLSSTAPQTVASNLELTLLDDKGIENVYGTIFMDIVRGNSRHNEFDLGSDDDCAYGGLGNDTISGGAGYDVLYGEQDDDVLYGGCDGDYVYGGDGNDTIYGEEGSDQLYGDYGDDEIHGGADSDGAYGGYGRDTIYGDGDADQLFGEYDDDVLRGGSGGDYMDSGYGVDELWGGSGNDWMTVWDDEGGDSADGEDDHDMAYGDWDEYGGWLDDLEAEEKYPRPPPGGGRLSGGGDQALLDAGAEPSGEELIYRGLQDKKTLRRWRELLWFYLEWREQNS